VIIDTHAHAFASRYPFGAGADDPVWDVSDRMRAGFKQRIRDRTWPWIEHYLERMDEAGIDVVCINNVACSLGGARDINDTYARLKAESNGRVEVLATIPVAADQHGADELRRVVREYGFKGAKVYPKLQETALDDRAMYPIYAAAAELDVPILTHVSAFPYSYSGHRVPGMDHSVDNLARLFDSGILKEFPTLTVIGAHLGGGLHYYRDQMVRRQPEYAPFFERLYVDIAPAPSYLADDVLAAARVHGEDHILFATDFPFISAEAVGRSVAHVEAMGLPDGFKKKLLGGNAARLLGITPRAGGR
jgi:predicted TIM-barrel fold metal-dependent hydrolase